MISDERIAEIAEENWAGDEYSYEVAMSAIKQALQEEREAIAAELSRRASQENCDDAGYDEMEELANQLRQAQEGDDG